MIFYFFRKKLLSPGTAAIASSFVNFPPNCAVAAKECQVKDWSNKGNGHRRTSFLFCKCSSRLFFHLHHIDSLLY